MATSLDLKSSYVQIVNGQSAPTATTRHGLNPANGQALPEVPVATEADLDRAVQCAKAAFRGWSATPYEQRRRAVLAFADAIEENYTGFRELLTLEQGKPIPQATAEMDNAISWMRGMVDLQLPEEVAHDDDSHAPPVLRASSRLERCGQIIILLCPPRSHLAATKRVV